MNLKITTLALLLLGATTFSACNKDDNPTAASSTVQLAATINSQQEVPTNTSTGVGAMTGSYDKTTRLLTYSVTYQGIAPSAGHIHQAAPGVNGGVSVPFASVASSPITGSATLSEADGAKLLAGETYVNFHTSAYASGEIRGNIKVQ